MIQQFFKNAGRVQGQRPWSPPQRRNTLAHPLRHGEGGEGFISYFQYISDIRKSYNNGDIALFFHFDIRQLTHCVQYIGVSFGVKIKVHPKSCLQEVRKNNLSFK
ncbi:hypothetical protein, partial [Ruminococcus sp.]|uniref:hypothetical protein n=1 Tax=Ruminococcus sp. TaxID=41978 RepID=UPI0025D3F91A